MSIRYYDWIAHYGRRNPDKPALIDLGSGRRFSYGELDERVARLASHLRDTHKVSRGDRVAVLALNTTDTMEVQFACFRLGAIFLPLNNRLTVPELQFIVGDAAPVVMIHDADLAETALTVARLCNVASALKFGPGGSYESAIAAARPLTEPEIVTLDDVSTIMYTSGTTGLPKGAIITHGMTFWNCVNLGGPAYISPASVLLTVLPLFHTGGLNCYTNPVMHAGGTVLIMRAFDPGEALKLISDPAVGINVFFGVPSIYQFMAQHPAFAASDFSRLIIGGVGGAPMPVPLLKVWEARGVALQQGYGMTETSPVTHVIDWRDAGIDRSSIGRPVPGTSARLIDAAGADVSAPSIGQSEPGELLIKGPQVMIGYLNNPEATAATIDPDGWLHTGDLATVDAEGLYRIVDRVKELIKYRGYQVPPAVLEAVLLQHPDIADAAAIGALDDDGQEFPKAFVVRRPGSELTGEQVMDFVAERVAPHEKVRAVTFIDAIPKSTSGKILRRDLKGR